MELKTYNDMEITLINGTKNPGSMVLAAIKLTMSKQIDVVDKGASERLLRYIMEADHGSVLEHVSMTFAIKGISRAFLAQITRHRMSSFTSASQHYANYADMPMIVHPDHVDEFKEYFYTNANAVDAKEMENDVINYQTALEIAMEDYNQMIDNGVPIYEARMVLPNAAAVNLMWTVNARSLANFLSQRLCRRNVDEARHFATMILDLLDIYWPEFAAVMGPQCRVDRCKQGRMSCRDPFPPYKD